MGDQCSSKDVHTETKPLPNDPVENCMSEVDEKKDLCDENSHTRVKRSIADAGLVQCIPNCPPTCEHTAG